MEKWKKIVYSNRLIWGLQLLVCALCIAWVGPMLSKPINQASKLVPVVRRSTQVTLALYIFLVVANVVLGGNWASNETLALTLSVQLWFIWVSWKTLQFLDQPTEEARKMLLFYLYVNLIVNLVFNLQYHYLAFQNQRRPILTTQTMRHFYLEFFEK